MSDENKHCLRCGHEKGERGGCSYWGTNYPRHLFKETPATPDAGALVGEFLEIAKKNPHVPPYGYNNWLLGALERHGEAVRRQTLDEVTGVLREAAKNPEGELTPEEVRGVVAACGYLAVHKARTVPDN